MGRYCYVLNCNNNDKNKACDFYAFPTAKHKLQQRNQWIATIKRSNPDGTPWCQKKFDIVCSEHFVGNKMSDVVLSRSYSPTIFQDIYRTKKCQSTVNRYEAVLARAEFDKNKNIKDLRVAKQLMKKVEKELSDKRHYFYKIYPNSPGGCAYQRDFVPADWILDYWDPMEKAMYPKYFALREQRKKEYEQFYRQEYGEPPVKSDHH